MPSEGNTRTHTSMAAVVCSASESWHAHTQKMHLVLRITNVSSDYNYYITLKVQAADFKYNFHTDHIPFCDLYFDE